MTHFPESAVRAATTTVIRALAPGGALVDTVTDALVAYVMHLARFGAHTDLVGARTVDALVEIALGDALALLPGAGNGWLATPSLELGAGGASLLVPLAIASPDVRGTLVEPRQKRAAFLRLAIGACGLAGRLTVDQSRIEPDATTLPVVHSALARAVLPPEQWVPFAARLVGAGGTFAVLTTSALARVPDAVTVIEQRTYTLPLSHTARALAWCRAR